MTIFYKIMSDQLIKNLLEDFHKRLRDNHNDIMRDCAFPAIQNKILIAIGMRRTGKTQFLFQQIQTLLKNNVPLHRILYINFEDDSLNGMTFDAMGKLLDAFYTVYPENHDQLCYFFLDEIQVIENWAVTIRRFFDTKNIKIFLSGSSSKLLSSEIATA